MDTQPTLEQQLATTTRLLADAMASEYTARETVDTTRLGRGRAAQNRAERELAMAQRWVEGYRRQIASLKLKIENQQLQQREATLAAALKRLSDVAVWDEDTDRDEFDAAVAQANKALALVMQPAAPTEAVPA